VRGLVVKKNFLEKEKRKKGKENSLKAGMLRWWW
jgi:hypothetical protein